MTDLPLHPSVVHIPLGLALVVPLVAAAIGLAWRNGVLPRRTWLVVVGLQLAIVLGGVAAMRSGEAEEERVERVVPEAAIEEHEDRAEIFVWSAGVALALAIAAALSPWERVARGSALAATIATVVVAALALRAGHAGGKLVYEHGAGRAYEPAAPTRPAQPEAEGFAQRTAPPGP